MNFSTRNRQQKRDRSWAGEFGGGDHMAIEPLKEVSVLKELEVRGCDYVPRLLEEHPEELYFVSTNCGKPADQISKEKSDQLFAILERDFGVRHLDAEPRNITYSANLGCFCIIDFELAEILPRPPGLLTPDL